MSDVPPPVNLLGEKKTMYRSSHLIGACVGALALATTAMAGPATGGCCGQLDEDNCNIQTEVDCLTNGGVYQGDDSDCSDCSQNNCIKPDENCQEPNIGEFAGGTILTSAGTADNVAVTPGSVISSICFWGAYISSDSLDCGPSAINNVSVTIYDNIVTIPPQPNLLSGVTTTVTLTGASPRATGELFGLQGFDFPIAEFEYTATLDTPYLVGNNDSCVWIQIVVETNDVDCTFFWEVSTESIIDPIGGDGDDVSWNVDVDQVNDFDMAFCIDQALGDANSCALPLNEGCVPTEFLPNTGRCVIGIVCEILSETTCNNAGGIFTLGVDCREPCNIENPFTHNGGGGYGGCDDPACCTLVCEELPTCCIDNLPGFGWIQACVDIALDVGCVESPLCGGDVDEANCQPFSTANAYLSTFDPSNSDNDQATAADDFTPLNDGAVSIVCWQGVLAPLDPQNIPADDFTITYYSDAGGFPGAVIGGPFSQSGGSLNNLTVIDTNLNIGALDINEYTAEHAAVNVSAGECYWLEIKNGVGDELVLDGDNWFWEWAREAGTTAPFYSGNGRCAVDGVPPDGWDIVDYVGSVDLAFCLKDLGPLQTPTCGLGTIYLTGTEEAVCGPTFENACDTGTIPHLFLGYSSGYLNPDFPQRRTAQPFTLGTPPEGTSWNVQQLFVYGFVPAGILNEEMHYEIFSRATGLFPQPLPEHSLIKGNIPFGATTASVAGTTNPQEGGFPGALHSIATDFNLPAGDYYLSVWANNAEVDGMPVPSNFAWFANADTPPSLNNLCADPCIGPTPEDAAAALPDLIGCDPDDCASTVGTPVMWRQRHFPAIGGFGFGQYTVVGLVPDNTTFDPPGDPDPDPDDLYNSSFFVRGGTTASVCGNNVTEAGETCDPPGPGCSPICQTVEPTGDTCPWDCQAMPNNDVGINDFLDLLGQWTQVGASCDFGEGPPGVGVEDFLALLGHWGPCP